MPTINYTHSGGSGQIEAPIGVEVEIPGSAGLEVNYSVTFSDLVASIQAQLESSTSLVVPIVNFGASNIIGGGDYTGATLTAADEDPRIKILNPNNGQIEDLDHTVGIPRPGGIEMQSTTPTIAFARALADAVGGDVTYVIVPTAVGGRTFGSAEDPGPWYPVESGTAWDIGDSAEATAQPGALYLAHTSGNFKAALDAALASQMSGRTVGDSVLFGHIVNENDADADFTTVFEDASRAMTDIRAAWGEPNAPWILAGGPADWTYDGDIPGRKEITSVNAHLAQTLPNVAFVTGIVGAQHPTEAIHLTNEGYREMGDKCALAIDVAKDRSQAPNKWVDWIDDLANKPARFFSFYRGRSDYAGPCLRLSNGSSEIDVPFDANGICDFGMALAHAAGGDAWITGFYDQITGAMAMVPEGSANALVVRGGNILTQGRRLAWGGDENLIQLIDSSYALTTAGALLAVGRMAESGTKIMAAGPQNTLGIFTLSGATGYAAGTSQEYLAADPQEHEPDWLTNGTGYNLHAAYVDAAAGYSNNGEAIAQGNPVSFQYGADATLCWGGRLGSGNRYSAGSHVALAAWDIAPTGADLDRVMQFCSDITAEGDTDGLSHDPIVVLIAGQSNSVGRAVYDGLGYHASDTHQWVQSAGEVQPVDGLAMLDHPDPNTSGDMGFSIGLSDALREMYPGRQIIFVPCGYGATAFNTGDWTAGTGPRYLDMVARANDFTAATGHSISFVAWHQGEFDISHWRPYMASFTAMMDQAVQDIDGMTEQTPWVLGELERTIGGARTINSQLQDLPHQRAYTALVASEGLSRFDNYHFDAASLRTLGARYCAAWAWAKANTAASGIQAALQGEWYLGDDNTAHDAMAGGSALTPVSTDPTLGAGFITLAGGAGMESPFAEGENVTILAVVRRVDNQNAMYMGNLPNPGSNGIGGFYFNNSDGFNARAQPFGVITPNETQVGQWHLVAMSVGATAEQPEVNPRNISFATVVGADMDSSSLNSEENDPARTPYLGHKLGIGDVAYSFPGGIDAAYLAVYDGQLGASEVFARYEEIKAQLAPRGIALT